MLGRVVLFFISATLLFGAVAKVDKTQITLGEAVTLTLSANGKNVEFPKLDRIDSFAVQSTGSSSQTVNNNGNITRTISHSYIFYPDKNVTISPIKIAVDGKVEQTKPLHVELVDNTTLQSQKDFELSLHVDNETPYVGELLKATITFKQNERVRLEQAGIQSMNFDSFWVKDKPIKKQSSEGGYNVQTLTFWISPLKEGNQTLGPVVIKAGIREGGQRDVFGMFFERLIPKYIRSKKLSLHVKPLPEGINLVGDFSINAFADKEEIESGKPVNVTVEVRGNGNFDDIGKMSVRAGEAVVYEDKPSVQTTPTKEGLFGTFKQKFAVIASDDTVIEPFVLKFLDKKTKTVKTIQTKPIKISVKKSAKKSVKSTIITPKNEKVIVKKEGFGIIWLAVAFVLGLMVGLLALVFKKEFLKPKVKKPFKSQKELLSELLPHYGKDEKLDKEIVKLESNLYKGTKESIDKKKIKNALKRYSL